MFITNTYKHLTAYFQVEKKLLFLSQIGKKVDDSITGWAFNNQLNQIKERKKLAQKHVLDPEVLKEELSILANKENALHVYMKKVSLKNKLGMILTAFKINPLRSLIVRYLIHPAVSQLTLESQYQSNLDNSLNNSIRSASKIREVLNSFVGERHQIERKEIYTSDHQQLDACLFYANVFNKATPKPILVMSLGNFQTYEHSIILAYTYAVKYDINVLLYNPRGVGYSLGKEYTTDHAIKDFEAVIRYALTNYCTKPDGKIDYNNLAVYGHSLGGGISVNALEKLAKEKKLSSDGIGLIIHNHSFTSIAHVVGHSNKLLCKILEITLWLLGIHSLNCYTPLVNLKRKLAKNVLVTTTSTDQIITGLAQLAQTLKRNKSPDELKALHISLIDTHNLDHNEVLEYLDFDNKSDHENVLQFKNFNDQLMRWRQQI